MEHIKLKAPAKINLTLDALKKRSDGYHELKMIMQEISLCDDIFIKKLQNPVIEIKTNVKWLIPDEKNLAYKAAELIIDRFNIKKGVSIEINKRIPISAGLAGGSADCAAVLKAINALFELYIPKENLMALGAELGSDVPFCILGGTALAEGRGEILNQISPCPKLFLVLVKIPVNVSTGTIFKSLDIKSITKRPNTNAMISAIESKRIDLIADNLSNVLETVTIPLFPKINTIKSKLTELGAYGTLMSGSGPTVYGIFKSREDSCTAADTIRKYFGLKDVFVCETINN